MKPDVFIATPTHSGDVCVSYTQSLFKTCVALGQLGLASSVSFQSHCAMISFARAILAQEFLDSGAEHFLSIDADLGWDEQGALEIIKSPHDVIGGVYPAKTDKPVFQARNKRESGSQALIEADGIPGGFIRVRRGAMLKMQKAYPELSCIRKGQPLSLLYETIILDDGSPLSEDYAFCERWRRIGGKVFIYPDIQFSHFGRKEWTGNMINDDPQLKVI
jgi:hypothetical protein